MAEKKVALVTGVSSGIGRAIASLLSERGFRVFGTMRKPSEADRWPGNVGPIRLDVRDEESVRSSLRAVLDQAGRIDALVNNAATRWLGLWKRPASKKPGSFSRRISLASCA